ncbi:MAG: EAL domain-containing protein, partial [Oscillibacter sp.]|nr:EAL domain-containing protein [Oscillibacter sp.]
AVSKADAQAVGIMIGLSALGVIIQGVRSDLPVDLFAESLTFLGLLVMLEERGGHIDPVTGALNRAALVDANRRLIETNQTYRVLLVKLTDLDLFSRLFHGREVDSLLILIAAWLASAFAGQNVYHFRDGVFAILCPDASDQEAGDMAGKILARFGEDWKTGEASLRLEAAVCVIRVPEDVSALDELMELLVSGYQKEGMGSRLVPFEELSAHRRNRKIEQALREAVEGRCLRVWYQPIWSVEEKRTVAAEALLRIDSEALRGLSPEAYIPIAEQCGIIREIGLFVFEDVCRFLRDSEALGLSYIELNLSVHQFMYDDLVKRFEEIRIRYGIPRSAINLEITETASTGETPAVEQAMGTLRTMGYTFSLDDFGTGYSNLVQLIRSSYKNVKMDKSLLWDAERNENTARLLDSLIHVIRSLGYNVIQEGVETPAQLDQTVASGGNLIQGYYFSRPLPEQDFAAYMEAERRKRVSLPAM